MFDPAIMISGAVNHGNGSMNQIASAAAEPRQVSWQSRAGAKHPCGDDTKPTPTISA